jgi:hypothetical protein
MRLKLISSVLVVTALAVITGCSSSSSTPPPPPAITVAVSPATAQLSATQTQQFTATVTNTSNTAVTWSIPSGAAGTMSATGLYTAPSTVASQTTVTVTATSQADTSKSGSATITLMADAVVVTPSTANAYPGGTAQFSATVNGTASTAVTWTITGSQGSIDTTGKYTAPNPVTTPGAITVTATSTADTTKTGTATLTLLQLSALTVSPKGPAIAANATEPFTAAGTFTDGTHTSTADWTSESTWTSSNTAIATIAGSTATAGSSVGVTTITATDTPSTISGSTVLSVTAGTLGLGTMSGSYVFSVTHAGTRGQAFSAGVFTADGTTGQITGGLESFNAPSATGKGIAISAGANCGTASPSVDSCYTVGSDGRGTLHLTTASRGTDTYDIVISSDGSHGQLIFSGTTGIEVGTFEKQSATTLGDGSYSLLLGGVDGTVPTGSSTQNPEVLAGQFVISGGNIASATTALDLNDDGFIDGAGTACGTTCPPPATPLQFSATYAQAGSTGRGTLVLIPTGGIPATQLNSGSWNFDYYVVSTNKLVLIQTDVQASTSPTFAALTGTVEKQTFAASPSLSGSNFVFLVERSAAQGLFGSAGQWMFGATSVTGEYDANCLQAPPSCLATTTLTPITASPYTIDATGRGTLAISASRSYIFYLIGDPATAGARMYILETATKSNAGVGTLQPAGLTLPATGTSLIFNLGQLATNGDDSSFSGQLVVSSATTLTGIADSNVAVNKVETPGTTEVNGASLVTPDAFGRGTLTLNIPNPNTAYAYYLVSPTEMVIFGTNSALTGVQAVDGSIEVQ